MGFRSALRALFVCLLVFPTAKLQAEIKVACFSTILSEIAQKVGGKNVTVTSLIKPGQDPHEYQLTPGDLSAATASDLVILSGKGMEVSYLRNLRDALPKRVQVLEVGDQLPSLSKKAAVDAIEHVFDEARARFAGEIGEGRRLGECALRFT